jgi:hypothetical protein
MNDLSRRFMDEMQGKLTTYYSLEEIETLAFVLGVDYDTLRGQTKPTKVNALLYELARNGRLPELLERVGRERSNVAWPELPPNFELPQGSAGSETGGATVYHIHGTGSGTTFIGSPVSSNRDVNIGAVGSPSPARPNPVELAGDYRGKTVNVDSSARSGGDPRIYLNARAQLLVKVGEMKAAIAGVPPAHAADAATLNRRLDALIEELAADGSDPETIVDLANAARRAAGKLAATIPALDGQAAALVDLAAAV